MMEGELTDLCAYKAMVFTNEEDGDIEKLNNKS